MDQEQDHDLQTEQSQYNDILQGDFIDSYRNMTLKSLLGLKIVMDFCPNVRYLLKTDDDMFINIPLMLRRLEMLQLKRFIMGPLIKKAEVRRYGKWLLTNEEFSLPYFPDYMAGSAYVITANVVSLLFETSHYVPYIFIDDVYITGILARIINVTLVGPQHRREFAYVESSPARACEIATQRVITSTGMTPSRLDKLWNNLIITKPNVLKKRCR